MMQDFSQCRQRKYEFLNAQKGKYGTYQWYRDIERKL